MRQTVSGGAAARAAAAVCSCGPGAGRLQRDLDAHGRAERLDRQPGGQGRRHAAGRAVGRARRARPDARPAPWSGAPSSPPSARSSTTSTRSWPSCRSSPRPCRQFSADGLTVTIKLRTGVKFADGTALDAAAVKTSLDRHMTLTGSARKSELTSVASVAVVDPTTVALTPETRLHPADRGSWPTGPA